MKVETLVRALAAVREKIEHATEQEADWRAERDRRRRQESAFLRGIVRAEGSQRKAAEIVGISQATISRTLDPEGHLKRRSDQAERDAVYRQTASADRDARFRLLASPEPPQTEPDDDNVVQLVPAKPETLRDLVTPNKNYWADRRVRDVYLAVLRCERFSPDGAAFLYTKGFKQLAHDFSGRMFDGDQDQVEPPTAGHEQGIAAGND
jgi:hypothetical protein